MKGVIYLFLAGIFGLLIYEIHQLSTVNVWAGTSNAGTSWVLKPEYALIGTALCVIIVIASVASAVIAFLPPKQPPHNSPWSEHYWDEKKD